MYSSLLFIHSWTRWVVVLGGIGLTSQMFLRWHQRRQWGGADNGLVWAFSQVFGYQVLFGLSLYIGGSPYTKVLISKPGLTLKTPVFFFWGLRHPATMLLALAIFQIGKRISQKHVQIEGRHRAFAVTLLLTMLAILSAIPWPKLEYGRSFFRWSL